MQHASATRNKTPNSIENAITHSFHLTLFIMPFFGKKQTAARLGNIHVYSIIAVLVCKSKICMSDERPKSYWRKCQSMLRYLMQKGVTVKQRFALINGYESKEQPLTLVGAVAFLMSFIFSGLPDTDNRHDDTDNRYYNTDKLQNRIQHQ